MKYEQFLENIKKEVKRNLETHYKIEYNQVIKNNGVVLDEIVICNGTERVSLNRYFNHYYEKYENGTLLQEIVEEILITYQVKRKQKIQNQEYITLSYEQVQNSIVYRLINYSSNKERLKQVPFLRFMDLAITFHCVMRQDSTSIGTIPITKELIEEWSVAVKQLLQLANKNTPRLFPAKIQTMNEVIKEFMKKDMEAFLQKNPNLSKHFLLEEEKESITTQLIESVFLSAKEKIKIPMYIMTNSNGINGASVLLYKNIIREFSKKCNSDLYILPSSIHEVILVPYEKSIKKEVLEELVFDVNRTQVPTEDILSNQVYLYRYTTNKFE